MVLQVRPNLDNVKGHNQLVVFLNICHEQAQVQVHQLLPRFSIRPLVFRLQRRHIDFVFIVDTIQVDRSLWSFILQKIGRNYVSQRRESRVRIDCEFEPLQLIARLQLKPDLVFKVILELRFLVPHLFAFTEEHKISLADVESRNKHLVVLLLHLRLQEI